MTRRLHPPVKGAANHTATVDTPELFCPPDSIRNIRPYQHGNQRPRVGPRPGLVRAFSETLGGGAAVQAMTVVSRASGVSGYEPGEFQHVTSGVSRSSGTLAGHVWCFDQSHGMFCDAGAGTGEYAYGACWHPSLRRLVYYTAALGPAFVTRVRMIQADPESGTPGATVWMTDIGLQGPGVSPQIGPIYGNAVLVTDVFVFVCAGAWVHVLRTSDGTYLNRYDMNGWSQKATACCLRPDGLLAVCFIGSNVVRDPVTTNDADTGAFNGEGSHFRSGVALFAIDETRTGVLENMLSPIQYGPKRRTTPISISSGSWDSTTRVLSTIGEGAFSSYSHVAGAKVVIESGTGVSTGEFAVESKASASRIILSASIGSSPSSDVVLRGPVPPWNTEINSGGAIWNPDNMHLRLNGAFRDYVHVDGSTVEITWGTFTTTRPGRYLVARKHSNDVLILAQKPNAVRRDHNVGIGRLLPPWNHEQRLSSVAWNPVDRSLTATNVFQAYQHEEGSLIRITGGTGITPGSYLISEKISDTSIRLVNSIGSNSSNVEADQLEPPWYEDHPHFRFSEHVISRPRGRYPWGIAAMPDGSIAVAVCNRGWGPNSGFAPTDSVPPHSLLVIGPGTGDAELRMQIDSRSRLDPRVTVINGTPVTHRNDIPHPSDQGNHPDMPHPSAASVAVDQNGDIYVGGRTSAGYSVRKISGSSGGIIWEVNTGEWVSDEGIALIQGSGSLVVCGMRNSSWTGSGGAHAMLWWIDAATGEIIDTYDLGVAGIDGFGLAVSRRGEVAVTTRII